MFGFFSFVPRRWISFHIPSPDFYRDVQRKQQSAEIRCPLSSPQIPAYFNGLSLSDLSCPISSHPYRLVGVLREAGSKRIKVCLDIGRKEGNPRVYEKGTLM